YNDRVVTVGAVQLIAEHITAGNQERVVLTVVVGTIQAEADGRVAVRYKLHRRTGVGTVRSRQEAGRKTSEFDPVRAGRRRTQVEASVSGRRGRTSIDVVAVIGPDRYSCDAAIYRNAD